MQELISSLAAQCNDDTGNCNPKYADAMSWFTEFFRLCYGECKFDYLATHKYGCNTTKTTQCLKNIFGLDAWLTEFSCGTDYDETVEQQENYLKEIIPMLEESKFVYKCSWFVVRENETNSLLNYNHAKSDLTTLRMESDAHQWHSTAELIFDRSVVSTFKENISK